MDDSPRKPSRHAHGDSAASILPVKAELPFIEIVEKSVVSSRPVVGDLAFPVAKPKVPESDE